jgi:hypothetical protein
MTGAVLDHVRPIQPGTSLLNDYYEPAESVLQDEPSERMASNAWFRSEIRMDSEGLERLWGLALRTCGVSVTDPLTDHASWIVRSSWADWEADFRVALAIRLRTPSVPGAWQLFGEVAAALGVTRAIAAAIVGVGRTTPIQWSHGRDPQPDTANRLLRLHAVTSGLRRQLGERESQLWWHAGAPSRIEMLRDNDLSAVEDAAASIIFGDGRTAESAVARYTPDEPSEVLANASATASPRRRARKAPRRRTS